MFITIIKSKLKKYLKSLLFKLCEYNELDEEFFIEKYYNKFPKVKNVQQTIQELINSDKSIIRFGDGELKLIEGNDIPFQKSTKQLSDRLREILSSDNKNILIGLPFFIYSSKENLQKIPKEFWTINGKKFRHTISNYINVDSIYYASELTIVYSAYKIFNISNYFLDLQKIWQDKNITIICGITVFDKIDYNIFENANSIEYLYAPSTNAFDKYDEILKSCLEIDKKRLLITILGPTAKVLVYDLVKNGYRALDLGHIAKAYDWYRKEKDTLQMKDAIEFFNPD